MRGQRNGAGDDADTPLEVLAKGAVAGLSATLLLSILSRMTFGTMDRSSRDVQKKAPTQKRDEHHPAEITPGGALARSAEAGPEGSAGKFALKVGSGLFGRDLSAHGKAAGEAVHFTYGTLWGALFGIVFASTRSRKWATGLGLGLWAIGPATLVPAMKLMPPLHRYPAHRTALLIAGHLVYGWATLAVFRRIHRP